jgi:peptide/nickel transport system ATP-binding protein
MTEDALLSVRGLHVSYRTRDGAVHALRGVDLEVRPGEVVGLVGESGSGKSTAAHTVLGLLPAGGRVEAGSVLFDGTDLLTARPDRLRALRGKDIALIPQDPMVSLNPVQRVGRQVAEVLVIHGLARGEEADRQAVDILALAGLPEPDVRARQYPHELSGGMRQRALIAIAVAARPRLIVADEPTSALDVTVQRQILDHIETLAHERGTAVLLVTHDLGVAADRAHRVAVMRGGEIVESGPVRQILERPEHPYTRRLLAAVPGFADPLPRAAPRPPEPAAAGPAGADDLLAVRDLVKDYPLPRGARGARGERTVRAVAGVSFRIGRGETFALVGESGSGKSTTARMVLRLAQPTSGKVEFDGQDVTGWRGGELRRLRRRMQVVYQNPYASLDPRMSVADIVTEPLRVFRTASRAERRMRASALLERVELPAAVARRKPAELSGGQRQRVAIARALALEPSLVVCDEPVSALDVSSQTRVLELLAQLRDELGLSFLLISHDLAVVRRIADRVGVMRRGELVETGTVENVFTAPAHPYTAALLAAVPGGRQGA